MHRPSWGSWHGIPVSTLPGTNHQVDLSLNDDPVMYGTHEPAAYGVCLVDRRNIVIHLREFLDTSPRFVLSDPASKAARDTRELALPPQAVADHL